ncbi:hypothetical protein BAE27_10335 [Acidithiobacillus caldus]|uniref:Uncharacterized protein n=1 Tax=Acidithiobacillus caldus TaxID=33059 RepID=A0A1E7YL73_9PROT|nr:hypothetical protein BAE27_10335 [Acidithiobacillus caldus]
MPLTLLKAAPLLFTGHGKPECDEKDTAIDEVALEFRSLAHEFLIFQFAAETHDPFHAGPVVPGAVEEYHFTGGGQLLHITLEVPLSALFFRGFFQGHDPRPTGIEVLHEALDGATLAGGVATLENHDHPLSRLLDPGLKLEQFHLQAIFLALVLAACHAVPVGILTVPPTGIQGIVDAVLGLTQAPLGILQVVGTEVRGGGLSGLGQGIGIDPGCSRAP